MPKFDSIHYCTTQRELANRVKLMRYSASRPANEVAGLWPSVHLFMPKDVTEVAVETGWNPGFTHIVVGINGQGRSAACTLPMFDAGWRPEPGDWENYNPREDPLISELPGGWKRGDPTPTTPPARPRLPNP